MMVLHLTMPFRGVRFIFIVSPFHRKIAGREYIFENNKIENNNNYIYAKTFLVFVIPC
ncbi:hypothetical protein NQ317_002966 [Molorchus minor]|uniref:Uncharacterized protein n=1 Tax=Molorchus minor TaxID=1323400 RepID=A0ABQ9J8Q9_9CUCU|nr:hypothetical protein NQ317_002966 [Molorchus minor]